MKTSILFGAFAVALPAFASPLSPSPTPAATNAPVPKPDTCVNQLNICRSINTSLRTSVNQAQCSSENAACIALCYSTYNRCRTGVSASQPLCASNYAGCLGENPFAPNGTLVIKPTIVSPPLDPFGAVAYRVSSAIHYLPINASGNAFWINKETAVYCPPGQLCSNTTDTQFLAGSTNGTVTLDTLIPGGQQIFVAGDGRLSYTSPQSGTVNTVNSTFTGFEFTEDDGIYLKFKNSGFLACPVEQSWSVYSAAVNQKTVADNCLYFDFRIFNATQISPYQYA